MTLNECPYLYLVKLLNHNHFICILWTLISLTLHTWYLWISLRPKDLQKTFPVILKITVLSWKWSFEIGYWIFYNILTLVCRFFCSLLIIVFVHIWESIKNTKTNGIISFHFLIPVSEILFNRCSFVHHNKIKFSRVFTLRCLSLGLEEWSVTFKKSPRSCHQRSSRTIIINIWVHHICKFALEGRNYRGTFNFCRFHFIFFMSSLQLPFCRMEIMRDCSASCNEVKTLITHMHVTSENTHIISI